MKFLVLGLTFFFLLAYQGLCERAYSSEYLLTGEWLTACEPVDALKGCRVNEIRPFIYPAGIAIDSSGSIYLADLWRDTIQKFTNDGEFIAEWGTTGSGDGEFYLPAGIALDSADNLYITDLALGRIQKFTNDGEFITKWGTRGSGDGEFYLPVGIATDPAGNVFVVDQNNNRIQKFTNDGEFITKWGKSGVDNGNFLNPKGIATDPAGNVFVVDQNNNRIQKFTNDGEFITKWGTKCRTVENIDNVYDPTCMKPGDGEFYHPDGGIATDPAGNVFVVDQNNNRIQKFTNDGKFITKWNMPNYRISFSTVSDLGLTDIVVDPQNKLYTTYFNDRVLIYSYVCDDVSRSGCK